MPSHSIETDLKDFVEFAARRIERGEGGESIEVLLQQWRSGSEFDEAVADVRKGLADEADGRAESAANVFAAVRRRLGIIE